MIDTSIASRPVTMSPSSVEPHPARSLRTLFCTAVLIRIVVFLVIGVSNNDDHFEVVRYVAEHGTLATIDQFNQAYHPPLYYVLAAAVFSVSESAKTVQFLSLLFSIAGLSLAWHLVSHLTSLSPAARFWSLMLVSLHPQFIMYTMFISNDPLAVLLGLGVLATAHRYLNRGTVRALVALAIVLGLGLATKFTFLAFILPVALVVWMASRRQGSTILRTAAAVAILLLVVAALGSYKFTENARHAGSPFASNLDVSPWSDSQKPTWTGAWTLLDFNVAKLVRHPTVSEETVHSYPLLLYGTYWYQFIPDSTFRSNTKPGLNLLGSMIYVCAIPPTVVMVLGFGIILWRGARWLRSGRKIAWRAADAEHGVIFLAALMLFMNLVLLVTVGWKHDVYSVFNARLLFPAYFGFLVSLATGIDWAARHRPIIHRATLTMLRALHAVFLVYLAVDVAIAVVRPVDPLINHHMPAPINMMAPASR